MSRIWFENICTSRYEILVEPGILGRIGTRIRALRPNLRQVIIITDHRVADLYGKVVRESLKDEGLDADLVAIEPGEKSKSLQQAAYLWERLAAIGFRRKSLIVALGGGVVIDLVGFVASTYMRGVAYVNVPTTLLAQLDAAVGSKVAVDHERAKNLIGSFYHPLAVYADPTVLTTLPEDELRHGLAEAIKVAIIDSPALFEHIEQNAAELMEKDIDKLMGVVVLAVASKVALLTPDLYENELRRALNFGHTTGHALETVLGYQSIRHGEAVAIGMAAATRMAAARGLCCPETSCRILRLLESVGLPTVATAATSAQIWEALSIIRNIRDGHFHEVLPTGIGSYTFTDDLSQEALDRYMYAEEIT